MALAVTQGEDQAGLVEASMNNESILFSPHSSETVLQKQLRLRGKPLSPPPSGSTLSEAGCGFGQLDLVGGIRVLGRWGVTFYRSPSQPKTF